MLKRNDELEFTNDVRAALRSRAETGWIVLGSIGALLVIGLLWAWLAVVEEVTTGEGRVIPSRQIQVLQAFEGGIIEEILVTEGEIVAKDQVLLRIDDTRFASLLGEINQRHWSLRAKLARLEAQANGLERPVIPMDVAQKAQHIVAEEMQLFAARKAQLQQEREILQHQFRQRELELVELKSSEQRLNETLEFGEKELEMTQSLFKRGAVPEIELIRLQRTIAEQRGQLRTVRASVPRALSAIAEAQGKLDGAQNLFMTETRNELTKVRGDLSVIEESLRAASDRVVRTALRSPVRGIVNKVNATTVGAVAQSGQNIMEIVPLDDTLLIEVRIRPQDVAFLHPGQKASVKITAYDYTIYGALEGDVERISADTITDEKDNKYYRAIVRTAKNTLGTAENPLPIIPGMVASVSIQTGEKSILSYLMKPIRKVRHEALRER